MFGNKKELAPQKRIDSLIGVGTTVEGNVAFTGGLRIDGAVRGHVKALEGQAATLVVSEQATVDGEIHVSHVVINGTVNGPVHADEYLELQAKARVVGDVTYRTLEMQIGAVVDGRLHHEGGVEGASVVALKRSAGD